MTARKEARRNLARIVRDASHQLGVLEARGEKEWKTLSARARKEVERTLGRVRRAVERS